MSDAAAERAALIEFILRHGGSTAEVERSPRLNELAVDVVLRPRSGRTMAGAVDATGVSWQDAEPLLAAIGLPDRPDAPVTDTEAQTIALLLAAGRDLFGMEAAIQIARVAANAMGRVAETLVSAFRLGVELPHRDAGAGDIDIATQVTDVSENWLPPFLGVLDAILRRNIVGISERMWSTDDERSAVTLDRTVGFVDLVGYTAATAHSSVRELTAMLIDFDSRTAMAVARGNGQVIKTIGDEAMFVTTDPADACRIALELADDHGGTLPAVRVGLAAGEMVSIFGDLYGPDVNLAARLVATAAPGAVVVSDAVAAAVTGGFDLDPTGPLDLKGIPGPVQAYRLAAR